MEIALVVMALLGALPLVLILYKYIRIKRILRDGICAQATIYEIRTARREPRDIVFYYYQGNDSKEYTGILTSSVGAYKTGQTVGIVYLPQKPTQHAVNKPYKPILGFLFGICFTVFVLVMVYRVFIEIEGT